MLEALNTLCGVNVHSVDITHCGLVAVPEALVGMESMTSLKLSGSPIKSGWERLCPLHQLQELGLQHCNLTEVPEALVGMESTTSLMLTATPSRAAGSGCAHCASCGSWTSAAATSQSCPWRWRAWRA